MKFHTLCLSMALCFTHVPTSSWQSLAFTPSTSRVTTNKKPTTRSSTELYIIGPMIRKMREEQANKNRPLAFKDDIEREAPGLKVGSKSWKWPPLWPYSAEYFIPKEDIPKPNTNKNVPASVAGLMNGNLPKVDEEIGGIAENEEEQVKKLDPLYYWSVEKEMEATEIDIEAAKKLTDHYKFYLKDGMSVLELGAAEESYLPKELKLSRHVGVGANSKLMARNPSLTESFVADLNKVVEEIGIDSDEINALEADSFDAIIMANTIDFLTAPREVFKSAWRVLKPGGLMMVPFTNSDAYTSKFGRAQTKMWIDMNDDQHMWVCGTFFQFSASDGWQNLIGFDISPDGSKKQDENPILSKLGGKKTMNMYVVQATKVAPDESIDLENPEKSFSSKMWLLPKLEDRDKKLLAPRLARAYSLVKTREEQDALERNVEFLPKIYECLLKMDQFAFPFGLQAKLAADLIVDPGFNGNDEQIKALKMGLGLRTPSKDFWQLVGERTMSMSPDDKVSLLAHIVPRFGSGDAEQEAALQAFVAGLKPTFSVIKSKCPTLPDADVQLAGTELLAAEILQPGRSTKKEFATWIAALTSEEIMELVIRRKSFKIEAMSEMKTMQELRKAEQDRIEALREKMKEQQKKAREERTITFNPSTGKFEELKK